jgi:hypothetical protein
MTLTSTPRLAVGPGGAQLVHTDHEAAMHVGPARGDGPRTQIAAGVTFGSPPVSTRMAAGPWPPCVHHIPWPPAGCVVAGRTLARHHEGRAEQFPPRLPL